MQKKNNNNNYNKHWFQTTSTGIYIIQKLELQCGDDSIHRHAKSAEQPLLTISAKTVILNGKGENSNENLP